MTPKEFILLLMSVLASVGGQVFLKLGATKLGRVNITNAFTHMLSILTTPELIIGLSCYGVGAVLYILLLTRVNLSVAGPSASLVYIFSVLLGHFLFRESIPIVRLLGLGFIIAGVVLVVWQK
jgi:drug/metabolite transporter (DMT)-like permease